MGRKPKTQIKKKAEPVDLAKRFEGDFHTALWRLLDIHSQSAVSEVVAKATKWSASTVRTHWNNRNWKHPEKAINSTEYFTAQIYPHIHLIAQYLSTKNDPAAKEALAFIRYRFLRESFNLGLYRPYAESHRFSTLLNWAYFPDDERFEREKYEPICFILAFNNDYQIYRHLCVLVDRLLTNPIHITYLSDILPKLAVLMTLFGDYHLAAETCRKAATQLAHAAVSYERSIVHRYELQCIEADAESHIPVPRGFEPAEKLRHFVVLMKDLADHPRRSAEMNSEEIDHLLRMGYCAYFRALLRIMLHLRISDTHYRLPPSLSGLIDDFDKRARAHRSRLAASRDPGKHVVYRRLYMGEHYSGLEFDTLARVHAFIQTELEIRRAKSGSVGKTTPSDRKDDLGREPAANILNSVRTEVGEHLQKANECLTYARELLETGDEDDQLTLVKGLGDRSMVPPEVNCSILSAYRQLSTMALLEIQMATFVDGQDEEVAKQKYDDHIDKAREHQRSFEVIVGVQHLRHARVLNERIQTMINRATYGRHLDWIELLDV